MLTVHKDTLQEELYKNIRSVEIRDLELVLCVDKTFLVILSISTVTVTTHYTCKNTKL